MFLFFPLDLKFEKLARFFDKIKSFDESWFLDSLLNVFQCKNSLWKKQEHISPSRLALSVRSESSTKTASAVINSATCSLISELFSSQAKHTACTIREKEQSDYLTSQ